MTTGRAYRSLATLLQVGPLALLASYLFLISKPPEPSVMPGVMPYMPPGLWYVFPLSIALGAFGVLAIFSEIAANAAAMLTGLAVLYGLRLWLPGDDPELGIQVVVVGVLSLVGFFFRWHAWGRQVSRS